jgi:hypothetical protein
MLGRTLAVWFILVAVAIANGALREGLLVRRFGVGLAHILSTGILCAAIVLAAVWSAKWISPKSGADAFLVGTIWLVLVLAFEFGFGHYVFGRPWSTLLADYNLAHGKVWLFVPLLTLFAPWLGARIRNVL